MATNRKKLPLDIKTLVLHEAGYKCANPCCRHILTLDIHHLDYISKGGKDSSDNLLALCPNCHSLHHRGEIPIESLRTWKMLLLSLNEGFDKRSIDLLLMLHKTGRVMLSGDGLLEFASLIASDLVNQTYFNTGGTSGFYSVNLDDKGYLFVEAWKNGNQEAAININGIGSK